MKEREKLLELLRRKENIVGVLELTKRLIEVKSPSLEEKDCSEFILSWFKEHKISAEMVSSDWDVVARIGKGKPSLLFNGHIDTIGAAPEWDSSKDSVSYKAIEHRGRIYGRGASDMKSGIACAMYTLKLLRDIPLKGSLVFSGVTREECSLYSLSGTGKLIRDEVINPDYAIVCEGTVGLKKTLREALGFKIGDRLCILKGSTTGFRKSKTGRLFDVIKKNAEKVAGEVRVTSGFGIGGETDIRYLLDLGIECVVLGPGYIDKCHTADEYVDPKKIVECMQIYALSALEILS
ncbi:MAG: M20 family metallopeptidase [Candidatus Methanofastidiosia archaeon]